MTSSRLEKLRAKFDVAGIDTLYVSDKYNVRYLTGKKGDDCYLFITKKEAYLVTDFRYREAMKDTPGFKYVETTPKEFVKQFNTGRLGFERNKASLSEYLDLKIHCGAAVLTTDLVESLRMIKDDDEIRKIAAAERLGCDAFNYILGYIRPGMTERQVALEINNYMLSRGAEGLSFDTIAIAGKKTSMPHGIPSDAKIEEGTFLTMDFGCVLDGYCSDMTRTVAIGRTTIEMKKVYDAVYKAQINACEKIRAGMTGDQCHALASDLIDAAGYKGYFGHGLGHGVGLEVHENPRFSPTYKLEIPERSVLSIEPGIYIPGRLGCRIEDLAIITSNGIINLALSAPKELITI